MPIRRSIAVAIIAVAAMVVGACSNAAPNDTGSNASSASSDTSKKDQDRFDHLELENLIIPCLYLDIDLANEIRGGGKKDHIVTVSDQYDREARSKPVRYCTSHRKGGSLLVTTLFDEEGDSTGYDSVSSYFDEQQKFDPMPVGIQDGFVILEDGQAMGLVLKTARHAVIVIEFGKPVSQPDRLVDMTAIPIDYEEAFFAGLDQGN